MVGQQQSGGVKRRGEKQPAKESLESPIWLLGKGASFKNEGHALQRMYSLNWDTACVSVHLQEVHAAGAGGRGDPDEAESGGGLVADVRGHHTADKLGSTKLPLRHHT